jgi:hypothetical protein
MHFNLLQIPNKLCYHQNRKGIIMKHLLLALWLVILTLQMPIAMCSAHEPAHDIAKAAELKKSQQELVDIQKKINDLRQPIYNPSNYYAQLGTLNAQLSTAKTNFRTEAQKFFESSKIPKNEQSQIVDTVIQNPEKLDTFLAYAAAKLDASFVPAEPKTTPLARDPQKEIEKISELPLDKRHADLLWTGIKAYIAEKVGLQNWAIDYREKLVTLNKELGDLQGEIAATTKLADLYQKTRNIEAALQRHQIVVNTITSSEQFTQEKMNEEMAFALANVMTLQDLIEQPEYAQYKATFSKLKNSITDYFANLELKTSTITMTKEQAMAVLRDPENQKTPNEMYLEKKNSLVDNEGRILAISKLPELRNLELAKHIYDTNQASSTQTTVEQMTLEEKAIYAAAKAQKKPQTAEDIIPPS